MSQVWIIKFVDERGCDLQFGPADTGLRRVRMAASDQREVELKADELLNRWLKDNPGRWSVSPWTQEGHLRDFQVRQIRELLA